MLEELADVSEIVEARLSVANQLLAKGYKLLAVNSASELAVGDARAKAVQDKLDGKIDPGRALVPFVRRFTVYVLGRPSAVPHVDPASLRRRPASSPLAGAPAGSQGQEGE